MKNLSIGFILVFFMLQAEAQWIKQDAGTFATLRSVFFINDSLGYVSGDNGTILKTSDGGANWIPLNSGTLAQLNSVYFLNAETGFIAGAGGLILKTSDGGITWDPLSTGTSADLVSLKFADENTGYVSGGASLKTTDGGSTWSAFVTPEYGRLWTVDTNTVYLVDNTLRILRTDDGASSWQTLFENTFPGSLNDICFSGYKTGIAVGGSWAQGFSYSLVYFSVDSGSSWQLYSWISSNYLYSCCFADSSNVFTVGYRGLILRSVNGLTTWVNENAGTNHHLYSVHFPTPSTGYIAGDSGTILKKSPTSNGNGEFLPPSRLTLAPNPATDQITVTLPGNAESGLLTIYDLQGREALKEEINGTPVKLDISRLQPGVYCLKIETGQKCCFSKFSKISSR